MRVCVCVCAHEHVPSYSEARNMISVTPTPIIVDCPIFRIAREMEDFSDTLAYLFNCSAKLKREGERERERETRSETDERREEERGERKREERKVNEAI